MIASRERKLALIVRLSRRFTSVNRWLKGSQDRQRGSFAARQIFSHKVLPEADLPMHSKFSKKLKLELTRRSRWFLTWFSQSGELTLQEEPLQQQQSQIVLRQVSRE